jgi:hypothetical protein
MLRTLLPGSNLIRQEKGQLLCARIIPVLVDVALPSFFISDLFGSNRAAAPNSAPVDC